jgi:MFS family permease
VICKTCCISARADRSAHHAQIDIFSLLCGCARLPVAKNSDESMELLLSPNNATPRYEFKVVVLLSAGLGLVGLDRFIFNPLFPLIAKDLHLNYQDLGFISATLALCWGLASLFSGRLTDVAGCKRVLVPATVAFSLLAGFSGLAAGLASLMLIRGLMGLAEGAYLPASIVATVAASKPARIGLNVGLQQMAQPLVGLAFGPLIAVILLQFVSWRWIFGLVAIPGMLLAIAFARVLRPDKPVVIQASPRAQPSVFQVLKYRNVFFNTLGMFCWLSCLVVLSAFMPNYLTDHLGLTLKAMGFVLTGIGVGSFVGMIALPALSDRIGRRRVILTGLAFELVGLIIFPHIGADPPKLFLALLAITFLNAGIVAITVGPLTSESVPRHLAGAATGIVVGLGEIFGGAMAPVFAGVIAQRYGIAHILQIATAAIILGLLIVALGIKEPVRLSGHHGIFPPH